MSNVQIGFVLDSGRAYDEYVRATGKLPPAMPRGANTLRAEFEADVDGEKRAAMLIKQIGFAQTAEEKARGEEASGLSLMIATDVDVEQGKAALREISERLLWPEGGES